MSNKLTSLQDGSLALPGGHISKQLVLSRLMENNSRIGHIVTDKGELKDYSLERLNQQDQTIYITGPAYPEAESAEKLTPKQAVRLISAVKQLQERAIQCNSIDLRYILIKNDEILFLPFNLVRTLGLTQNIQEELLEYHPYHNPDLSGTASISFTIASRLYEYFTDKIPFTGDSREEMHEKMRTSHFIPLELEAPGINKDLAAIINTILDSGKKHEDDQLNTLFDALTSDSLTVEVDQVKAREVEEEKNKLTIKLERKAKMNYIKRHYGTAAIILAAVFILVGFMIVPVIIKATAPPLTTGMSREEVVYTYYNSFNKLDYELIQDTYTNNAGEERFNIVSHQYVVNQVRSGYGLEAFLSAAEWDNMGRPAEITGQVVFGVTNIELKADESGAYLVSYEEYFPEAMEEDNPAGGSISRGKLISEKLTMTEIEDVWYISSIEKLSETPLETTIILKESSQQ